MNSKRAVWAAVAVEEVVEPVEVPCPCQAAAAVVEVVVVAAPVVPSLAFASSTDVAALACHQMARSCSLAYPYPGRHRTVAAVEAYRAYRKDSFDDPEMVAYVDHPAYLVEDRTFHLVHPSLMDAAYVDAVASFAVDAALGYVELDVAYCVFVDYYY